MGFPCGIAIIFRMGAVGNDKELDILKKFMTGPKAVPLIAVNLIKGFSNGDASSFKFYVNEGKSVD